MKKLTTEQKTKAQAIENLISQLIDALDQTSIARHLGMSKDALNQFILNKHEIGLKQLSELLVFLNMQVISEGEQRCPEHCTPLPDSMIMEAFFMIRSSYGAGPRSMAWQYQLTDIGLLETTDDGRVLLPK